MGGDMGDEYTIEWLAPPRSDPLVLRRTPMIAASLEMAVAQARIELALGRRLDEAVEGFRLLLDEKVILSRWVQPDGSLSDIALPPKIVADRPGKASDDGSHSDDPETSLRAA
jgi:hypothetical protein